MGTSDAPIDMTAGITDRDQIRFVMQSPQLINPISLPFMSLKEFTPRRLMFVMFARVLQSHEEFVLGDDIHINLIHVKMPSGPGNENRQRCGVNLKTRLSRKKQKWTVCRTGHRHGHSKIGRLPQLPPIQGWILRSTGHGVGSLSQWWCTAGTVRYRGNEVVSGCVTLLYTGRCQWGPF